VVGEKLKCGSDASDGLFTYKSGCSDNKVSKNTQLNRAYLLTVFRLRCKGFHELMDRWLVEVADEVKIQCLQYVSRCSANLGPAMHAMQSTRPETEVLTVFGKN
jgi:hypothetical protein